MGDIIADGLQGLGGSADKKDMTWQDKLARLQHLASDLDSDLRAQIPQLKKGGRLISSPCYGQSEALFLGLNPGDVEGVSSEFDVDRNTDSPVLEWAELKYWRTCGVFLEQAPGLRDWFDGGVTSAFVCPWRTRDRDQLYRLNRNPKGLIFRYSGDILAQMIEDHQARLLVVTGFCGPRMIEDILHLPDMRYCEASCKDGPYGTYLYRYSGWDLTLNHRHLEVFQIPHFSRAVSPDRLQPCAEWLSRKLGKA